jgi:hypothetical protein
MIDRPTNWVQATPVCVSCEFLSPVLGAPDPERSVRLREA